MRKNDQELKTFGSFAYMPGGKVAMVTVDSTSLVTYQDMVSQDLNPQTVSKNTVTYKYPRWGTLDDIPNKVLKKIYDEPTVATGIEFNITIGYGDGILPVKKSIDDKGELKLTPVIDNTEINNFLDNNDINSYLIEQLTDCKIFNKGFVEIIFNREPKAINRKVVELNHKEAVFSRITQRNDKGIIENHLYSGNFGTLQPITDKDIEITPLLDDKRPLLDLKRRMGLAPNLDGKYKDEKGYRYIIPVSFQTPGRFYYQQPYWWSIFPSSWYDFTVLIPKFKKAILENGMTIKYVVYISQNYWTKLFASEGIKDAKAMKTRKQTEYDNINDFLSGAEKSGKSIIAEIEYLEKEKPHLKIVPIENAFKGGEYKDDAESASNIISYTLGVHPSIIGAAPGRQGNINGTEARELFTIKQAFMKPMRDKILRPLHIIKEINGWPKDIFFTIPNMTLTRLDQNTGAQKTISQPAL